MDRDNGNLISTRLEQRLYLPLILQKSVILVLAKSAR